MNDLFIAAHIIYESIAPDDPTNAPVIIRAVFPSVNPIPAAAHPDYELSIDTTTGISAPPIGIIIKKPIKNDSAIIVKYIFWSWLKQK